MDAITSETRNTWIGLLLEWEREAYLDCRDAEADWCRTQARNLGWIQPENYADPTHTPNPSAPPPEERRIPRRKWRRKHSNSEINNLLRGTVQAIAAGA